MDQQAACADPTPESVSTGVAKRQSQSTGGLPIEAGFLVVRREADSALRTEGGRDAAGQTDRYR